MPAEPQDRHRKDALHATVKCVQQEREFCLLEVRSNVARDEVLPLIIELRLDCQCFDGLDVVDRFDQEGVIHCQRAPDCRRL